MERTGLPAKIVGAVENIGVGRKGLAANGQEHEGRLAYEDGIRDALSAFQDALSTADPQTMILAEEVFLQQELFYCGEEDTDTRGSLGQAIQSFEDAFLALEAVEGTGYTEADKTWPHSRKYRIHTYPKDAFHLACIAHRTRLRNSLRTPGINMIEKAVLQQRAANMTAAQECYVKKQEKALGTDCGHSTID